MPAKGNKSFGIPKDKAFIIKTLLALFLFVLPAGAGIKLGWDWVVDPATGKARRTLRVCFCMGEDFAVGNSTLMASVIEAVNNASSQCVGGGMAGKPCTAATAAADCPGGACMANQGPWKFTSTNVPTVLNPCPAVGTCPAAAQNCDIIIRTMGYPPVVPGGALTSCIPSAADASRTQCCEERFDPTPKDPRGRCITAAGVVGAPCGPGLAGCPAGDRCWPTFCNGGGNNGKPCRPPFAAIDCPGAGATCGFMPINWGTAGNDLDPISVESHELSHKCRLDHQTVPNNRNFIEPVYPGNHQRKISEKDQQARASSDTSPLVSLINLPIGPGGGSYAAATIDTGDSTVSVNIPPGAEPAGTVISYVPIMSGEVPSEYEVPSPYTRIAVGVGIISSQPSLSQPATITLHYSSYRVADPFYGAMDETTLTAFRLDATTNTWVQIPGAILDTAAATVTFSVSDLSSVYFGIGGSQGPLPQTCDVDGNGRIDIDDIGLIMSARGTAASSGLDPRDADHDGTITVNDARICTAVCTSPLCAP